MLSRALRSLLVTSAALCIVYGAGISTGRLAPSTPQSGSPMAGQQTDLSGDYQGTLDYPAAGLSGLARLVIVGNSFTLTIGSTTLTGRITATTNDRFTVATMVFETQPPGSTATSISLAAIKQGTKIWMMSLAEETVDFYFGNFQPGMPAGEPAPPMPSPNSRNGYTKNGGPWVSASPKPRRVKRPVSTPAEGPEDVMDPPLASPNTNADTSFFSKLKENANVVFSTPESMNMDETRVIELLISPSKSVADLKDKLTEPGKSGSGSTRYADRMEAQLTGIGFTITPMCPAIQPIEPDQVTKWMWQIRPKDAGPQRLDLTLNAVINDGKDRSMVETFKREINIKVSWTQRASSVIGGLKDLQWLWAVIIVPIAGAIYAWWHKKHKGRRRKK